MKITIKQEKDSNLAGLSIQDLDDEPMEWDLMTMDEKFQLVSLLQEFTILFTRSYEALE